MRYPGLPLLGLLLVSQPRLAAQWSLTVEATASYYGGTSRNGEADPTAFRPHHPTSLGLRVDRRFGRLRGGGGGGPGGGGGMVGGVRSVGGGHRGGRDMFEGGAVEAEALGWVGLGSFTRA